MADLIKSLELTGQDYWVLNNESPTRPLFSVSNPQIFYKIRDTLVRILDDLQPLKFHCETNKTKVSSKERDMVREAVGYFKNFEKLSNTIEELQEHGFMRQEISIPAHEDTIQSKLGHVCSRVKLLEDEPNTPRIVFIAEENFGAAEGALIRLPL